MNLIVVARPKKDKSVKFDWAVAFDAIEQSGVKNTYNKSEKGGLPIGWFIEDTPKGKKLAKELTDMVKLAENGGKKAAKTAELDDNSIFAVQLDLLKSMKPQTAVIKNKIKAIELLMS